MREGDRIAAGILLCAFALVCLAAGWLGMALVSGLVAAALLLPNGSGPTKPGPPGSRP